MSGLQNPVAYGLTNQNQFIKPPASDFGSMFLLNSAHISS
jgi:hypothetical protein